MKPADEELEDISSQLAQLVALGDAVHKNSSQDEQARREELATWLTRLYAPREVATLALAALDAGTKAFEAIELLEVKTKLDEECEKYKQASHTLQLKLGAWEAKGQARKELARKAAAASLAHDPKRAAQQAAKQVVRKLWQDWRDGRLKFSSGAEFARDVLSKFPILKSQKVIDSWNTKWRREAEKK